MKKLILLFTVTWKMVYAPYYCGEDLDCKQALHGEKYKQFNKLEDAKKFMCTMPEEIVGAALNGIPSSEFCKDRRGL